MIEVTLFFVLSQVAMFLAMVSDFVSLQFKERKPIFFCLIISATLICAHFFLLGKITAGIIVIFSILRFITCYFTTNKKFLYLFLLLNLVTLVITYTEWFDLIFFVASLIFVVGIFQADKKLMRKLMMGGTALFILYNALIISPMGVIAETSFLISNVIGYYRHHGKKFIQE